MREVRLVVAKEKCRRGMNAFMLFGCGHGIFNILHIVATVTQLLCAFLISRVFFHLYSQLLVFVCSFFFGVLIRIFIFCFGCVLCSWSNFFIPHGMVAICALCTYISICETNRVDAFFFFFFSLSALVCDCIWDAIELHCSVYTVQYLHFYLECKQKDAVTKLK